jgi:beta-lactamase class A
MTMLALAEAVQKFSDNAAANLLLRRIGMAVFNGFWRGLGDRVSRLDDMEPKLNHVPRQRAQHHHARGDGAQCGAADGGRAVERARHPAAEGLDARYADRRQAPARGASRRLVGGRQDGTGLPSDIPGTYVDLAWVEPGGWAGHARAFCHRRLLSDRRPAPDGDPAAEALLAEVGRIIANAAK